MKNYIKWISLLCFLLVAGTAKAQKTNPAFDEKLADSLGADEYGMKRYVLVILKTGTAAIKEKAVVDSLFRGHMENIGRLVAAHKLIVAGPMAKNDHSYRGIFILDVRTIEEAKAFVETDPAIRANLLAADLYSWYGSAALPLYLPYHDKVEKKKF